MDTERLLSSNQEMTIQESLVTLIVREKSSPDILEYAKEEVARATEAIQHQKAKLDKINQVGLNEVTRFTSETIELEIERVKYMLKNYLRARLTKVAGRS